MKSKKLQEISICKNGFLAVFSILKLMCQSLSFFTQNHTYKLFKLQLAEALIKRIFYSLQRMYVRGKLVLIKYDCINS